jgi:regulator of replication initiation timing
MGSVSNRIRLELQELRSEMDSVLAENQKLKAENKSLKHQVQLAYSEGFDQGVASRQAS